MQKISRSMQRGIPVYIFGAGRHGYECLELLENKHIKCDGFVVTKIQGNPKQINDYSVKTVDEVLEKNKRNLFVLAVMDIYKKEILTFLEGKKSEGAEIELAVF